MNSGAVHLRVMCSMGVRAYTTHVPIKWRPMLHLAVLHHCQIISGCCAPFLLSVVGVTQHGEEWPAPGGAHTGESIAHLWEPAHPWGRLCWTAVRHLTMPVLISYIVCPAVLYTNNRNRVKKNVGRSTRTSSGKVGSASSDSLLLVYLKQGDREKEEK